MTRNEWTNKDSKMTNERQLMIIPVLENEAPLRVITYNFFGKEEPLFMTKDVAEWVEIFYSNDAQLVIEENNL